MFCICIAWSDCLLVWLAWPHQDLTHSPISHSGINPVGHLHLPYLRFSGGGYHTIGSVFIPAGFRPGRRTFDVLDKTDEASFGSSR